MIIPYMPKRSELRKAAKALAAGAIGVLPTDTIYGIVGSALLPGAVERIYRLRERDPKKPAIVLVASAEGVRQFGAKLAAPTKRILKRVWPGKISVVLPCPSKRFTYLHRGTRTIAFRLPEPIWLRKFLRQTGPLVAPSANIEGKPPARTIREAKKYFRRRVSFYVDGGRLASRPSTLIAIKRKRPVVLRPGAVTFLGVVTAGKSH
jgi:L-threonylcarbamoyladenylate synthase